MSKNGTRAEWFSTKCAPSQSGCVEWIGARDHNGYGRFGIEHGKSTLAHRFAYELAFGAIPDGLGVLHRCDNPPCVNLAHLFLGTQADNVADMRMKGRDQGPPHYTGTKHPRARLSDAQVAAIRAECASGSPQRAVARRYGVSQSAISKAVLTRTWK